MTQLELRNLTRRFGEFTAVDGVNLSIESGEFFTLLGPSGCGKTTLLRMIAGFDSPEEGAIMLEGSDMLGVPPERRNLHTVFQSYALFPHLTVAQNIAFPLRMIGTAKTAIARRVDEALVQVSLAGFGRRFPNELSGGQRQRVALARALVNKPKMLLLDEPLAALDAKLRESMQFELMRLQREVGVTFVYVTHDQSEALALSHRIAVMKCGRVEQVGTPAEVYGAPRNRFVADFIGECNLLDAEVWEIEQGKLALKLGEVLAYAAQGQPVSRGDTGVLALRPEQIAIARSIAPSAELNRFSGTVAELLYRGEVTVYAVDLQGGGQMRALVPNSAPGHERSFKAGDVVDISWRIDAGLFLAE